MFYYNDISFHVILILTTFSVLIPFFSAGLLAKVHEKLEAVSEARTKLVEKADLVEAQARPLPKF